MEKEITINGAGGRIGRLVTYDLITMHDDDVNVVGLNDPMGIDAIIHSLTKNDPVHRRFKWDVKKVRDDVISIDGVNYRVTAEKAPNSNWLGADIVVECSGFYGNDKKNPDVRLADAFFNFGAEKVLQSYDAEADLSLVMGMNHKTYDPAKHHLISNASCTTKASVMPLEILERRGKENGFVYRKLNLLTVHAATASQNVLDVLEQASTHSTNANNAIVKLIPSLEGKVNATSNRVPILDGSIAYLFITASYDGDLTKDIVNGWFREAVSDRFAVFNGKEMNVNDIQGEMQNSIVALKKTTVDQMMPGLYSICVVAGYDNERGSARDLALATQYVLKKS
jgi:glyceraldehyde-3-phosphate dehydrogenase type I